jgi:hypothetical protein
VIVEVFVTEPERLMYAEAVSIPETEHVIAMELILHVSPHVAAQPDHASIAVGFTYSNAMPSVTPRPFPIVTKIVVAWPSSTNAETVSGVSPT